MKSIKNLVFNYLTKNQKSDLCHCVSKFVKKHFDKTTEEIISLYFEESRYYLDMGQSNQIWIGDFIDDDAFYKDMYKFVKETQISCEFKERQKPILEKQKIYMKEQRRAAQKYKMSKTPPTPKQLSYYKSLCKKFDIEITILNIESASKLDLKNAIEILLTDSEKNQKESLLKNLESNNS